jgi:hypothetical protein
MSNTNETLTTTSKSPTHDVLVVREGRDQGYWTRIGAAWPHKDGKGFNILIDTVPLNGRISLRVVKQKK